MTRREARDTETMLSRLTDVLLEHRLFVCEVQAMPRPLLCRADAESLRRISMTLHRWHELECGIDNGGIDRDQKWAIERCAWPASDRNRWWDGSKWVRKDDRRTYSEEDKTRCMEGLPTTRQWNSADYAKANAQGFPSQGTWRQTGEKVWWYSSHDGRKTHTIPDREAGALKRLAAIAKRYPALQFYVQSDPRGCPLYVLRPGDVPDGEFASSYYTRGLAVHQ